MFLPDATLRGFLTELGSAAPAPGGGSVAALSGAMGAALVSMVCNLTIGRERYAEFQALVKETLVRSDALVQKLIECAQDDVTAFDGVIAALRMPRSTGDEAAARNAAVQRAYMDATSLPERTANNCLEVMRLALGIMNRSNKNAASDLNIAALQAHAGLISAVENVRINLKHISDAEYAGQRRLWADEVLAAAGGLMSELGQRFL